MMKDLAPYAAAVVTIIVAILNISYSLLNARRQSRIDISVKQKIAKFESELKERSELRQVRRQEESVIANCLLESVRSLQEFRDTTRYILENAEYPESLSTKSALDRLVAARKQIEVAYGSLSAHVSPNAIKDFHSAKLDSVKVEAAVQNYLVSKQMVPTLTPGLIALLEEVIKSFFEAQLHLRDLLQRQQLALGVAI